MVVEVNKYIIKQVNDTVYIALAGGTDDGEIGTSIEKIQTAIDSVSHDRGVLLVYDLGSAKMNAELAIEMGALEKVKILEAPILEGAYVAARSEERRVGREYRCGWRRDRQQKETRNVAVACA